MRSTLNARSPSSTSSANSARERRLLDLVFALEEVNRIGRAGGNLLADGGGMLTASAQT